MGRNPKIRDSYDHDVQYLLRLKHALEDDNLRPVDWRSDVMTSIQGLVELLIQAPPKKKAVEVSSG